MSASREKKNRQERLASGAVDPKAVRREEERQKERRSNRLYITIAAVFVVAAALLLVWNSGIVQRKAVAAKVDGKAYTTAELDYYYTSSLNSINSSGYTSYFGLDTSKSMKEQSLNDTAKMLLGVSEDMTWDAYLKQDAVKKLTEVAMTVKAADEAGVSFTDEMQKDVDATMDSLAEYAKQNGYSAKAYLKAVYGKNMTMSSFKSLLHDSVLASHYQEDYENSLTYTDEEVNKYYKENKDSFDVANYEFIYFQGTAASTTDDDGNTVEPTDAENKAAEKAAKADSAAALKDVQAGKSMEKIAEKYDEATYSKQESGSNVGDSVSEWVFDEARKDGDTTVVKNGSNYYVLKFHSCGRHEYNTVNVRHILFMVDNSTLDKESETYEADLQKLKDEAKAKAEDALKKWKEGDATEESFAALANELSEDGGSNTNGGLYEQVPQGQMVPEFNDWIFDSSRKIGDTGIVFNEGNYIGYHVMYFVGEDAPYWQVQVRNTLQSKDFSDWKTALLTDVETSEESGMKYVGR